MKNLNKYYSTLFQEAKWWNMINQIIEILFFILLIDSFLLSQWQLYLSPIFCLTLPILFWCFKKQCDFYGSLAHKIQEYAMLYDVFKKDTFNFDLSQIKGAIGLSIHKKVKSLPSDPPGSVYTADGDSKNQLLLMMQENCFFNHHLYQAVYKSVLVKIFLLFIFLAVAFLFSQIAWNVDENLFVSRIILTFFTAVLLYNELDKVWTWRFASKAMLMLDNAISRQKNYEEDFMLLIFARYNLIKSTTPIISNRFYYRRTDKLNEAWATRSGIISGTLS